MGKIFTILFFVLIGINNITAATFSSVASGTWSAPATWTITSGTDADGIPDADDDVTINAGHNVSLAVQTSFKTLTIQSSGTLTGNSQTLNGYGNFTNNGSLIGVFTYVIRAVSTFSSSSVVTNTGNWYVYANFTIAAGTTIIKQNYIYLNGTSVVTNFGSVRLYGGSIGFNNSSSWVNDINSSLEVAANFTGNLNLICSATGNTVIYNACGTVLPKTYYNLILTGGGNKNISADLNVLNNLTIAASGGNVLYCNNFNINLGGNWTNSANTNVMTQGIITFNGSGTQVISRPGGQETLNNIVLSGSGTVQLASTLNVTNLTINSGTFDVGTGSQTVFLRGNLINNSSLNCRAGTISLSGSTSQSISGSSNTQFYNLTLNNNAGCVINSAQSLTNVLTLTTGNFNSNGNFTLISDATKTARIAPKGAGTPSFSGSMTIQKFISGRSENWHDLSSPVTSTTIMDWDNEMYMSGIGADDGTPGPAGVDGSAGGFYSVTSYNESTAAYTNIVGSSTPVVSGTGYEIWLADDQATWFAKTIDTRGTPTFGDKTINLSYSPAAGAYAGVNLVGNPFASSINYASCTKTNVTGNILILDNSGNYNDYGASPVIPPHQGFWITASGSGASLKVLETAKSTVTATSFYRTVPNFGIKLMFSNPNLPFYNENTINFESNTSKNYDRDFDALYLKSPNKTAPAMFMYADGNAKLITNAINTNEEDVTIPLGIYTPIEGRYNIEPTVINTGNYNYVWIENIKTGKKFNLDASISFDGKTDETNNDYVLRLSKKAQESFTSQSVLENDVIVFNTESQVNVKAYNTNHQLNKISIFDISGKLLLEQSNLTLEAGNTIQINISSLSEGLYIVNVIDESNHSITKKIIR